MDDLKIVLYIVAAIIWVVYNNYKKISDASKKRDFSKQSPEVIVENWPKSSPTSSSKPLPKKMLTGEKQVVKPIFATTKKEVLKARSPLHRTPLVGGTLLKKTVLTKREGGNTKPSNVVHFEDQSFAQYETNYMVEELRNLDLRKAFIMSEVLKRPYN